MKHLLLTTIAAVLLVGCGPSVDIWTAAKEGNIEVVKQHLDAGVDVNARTAMQGITSLHSAAFGGEKKVAILLITAGADVNAKDEFGYTPLHLVAIKGHKEIVELLIAEGANVDVKDHDGVTPLPWAADRGHKEIAEVLVAKGADVNVKDTEGRTPLDWAERRPGIAELLRKHGGKTGAELKAEGR